MKSSISRIRWDPVSSKELSVRFSGDFFLYSRKERKMEMVKWIGTNFIIAQAFERLLDGHATNEQHE